MKDMKKNNPFFMTSTSFMLFTSCGVALFSSAAVAPVGGSPETPQSRQETSIAAVVEAAANYVKEYQDQLTRILADESYTQQIRNQIPADPNMSRSRTLKSEIAFMFADRTWMAIRDVMQIDGKPVSSRPDLRADLQLLPAAQVAGKFKTYNSRFNLGRVIRNFNEPTLSLLVLDSRYRDSFKFERKRVGRSGGTMLVTLGFTELKPPWLIHNLDLAPVFSTGELVVEAGTGRVRRTLLRANIGSVQMELTTIYAPEARLGIWVPTLFREHYEEGVAAGNSRTQMLTASGQVEEILCEARYANFRRFETTARIK
jgi:hypothetical protein